MPRGLSTETVVAVCLCAGALALDGLMLTVHPCAGALTLDGLTLTGV